MAADRLIIFCKAPTPGLVKTRLTPVLTPAQAAHLYEASIRDVVALAGRERARVELWCDAPESEAYFENHYPHLPLRTQFGATLGVRQRDAFERSFADGAERVTIIGTDSPTLPESHLNAAFDAIRDSAIVLGPSRDGGYYLIGLQRATWPGAAALFDAVDWSTDRVLTQLMTNAARLGLEPRLIPGWYDVDVAEDLELLRADAAQSSNVGQWLSANLS